jgi:hypothetical protein
MKNTEDHVNNMKAIIEALKTYWRVSENNSERWMDTKTGWNALNENSPLTKIAESIYKVTRQVVRARDSNPQIRERLEFSIIRKKGLIGPWRKEEALERLLTAHHDKLRNQYAIGGGKESIDLIRVTGDHEITEIYELKHDCGNDTPLYATIELLKNYFLMVDNCKAKHLRQLILLANQTYYPQYQASWAAFRIILEHINRTLLPKNVSILTQIVACGTPEVVDAINTLNWELNWRINNETELYDEIVRLDEDQVRELAGQIGAANLEIHTFVE